MLLGTVGTGILEGASGTSRVVPTVLGTVRTETLESPVSGTSRDVPSSPNCSWDC